MMMRLVFNCHEIDETESDVDDDVTQTENSISRCKLLSNSLTFVNNVVFPYADQVITVEVGGVSFSGIE